MQRSPPFVIRRLEVCAFFNELADAHLVPEVRGHGQGAEPIVILALDVGTRFQQHIKGVRRVPRGSHDQRRRAAVLANFDLRAVGNKQLDDAPVTGERCVQQRRPTLDLGRFHFGAVLKELAHDAFVPVLSRDAQRRGAIVHGDLDVCPGLQQEAGDGLVPSLCGHAERRSAVWPRLVNLCAGLHEHLHQMQEALPASEKQRGPAVAFGGLDIGAFGKKQRGDLVVPAQGRVQQRGALVVLTMVHRGVLRHQHRGHGSAALRRGNAERRGAKRVDGVDFRSFL
mmetsp:Transcript_19349/g.73093  ORF Transcript_19349/g.73093 Transcript_19349/m.73093 type:complete len:283 (-) Transcript_19349:3077-3925(-)